MKARNEQKHSEIVSERRAIAISTRARTSPLTANLGELALADLLQTLVRTGKDAVVTIRHDGKQSRVWCEAGRIIDAESPPFVGSAAFGKILSIEHGQVTAVFERAPRVITIRQPLDVLILEHLRLLGAAEVGPAQPTASDDAWPVVSADERVQAAPAERLEHAPTAPSGSGFRPWTSAATRDSWQDPLTAEAAPVAEDEPTAKQRQMISVIQKPVQHPSFAREPNRRRRVPLVLLASALGVGLGSWLGLQWQRGPAPPTPVEPLQAASPATAAPISLDVWAEPAHAELRLDGSKIAVGHALHSIVDDGREHVLEVSADGYHAETLRFTHVAPSGRVILVPKTAPPAIELQAPASAAVPPVARARRPRVAQAETLGEQTKPRSARPEIGPVQHDPKIRVIESAEPKIRILE